MVTGYTPKWKNEAGDVLIFLAENTLFDTFVEAVEWRFGQFLFMIPFGLTSAGIFEFEHQDGKFEIPHVVVKCGKLGEGCALSGPLFDAATSDAQMDGQP